MQSVQSLHQTPVAGTQSGSQYLAPPAPTLFQSGGGTAKDTVAIVGSGNSAYALSCYLSNMGHPVNLLARSTEKLQALASLRIKAAGILAGEFELRSVTANAADALLEAKTVFVTTVTTAYPDVARNLAPYLTNEHEVVLFSSKMGGVIEFSNILNQCGAHPAAVLETDALFPCRIEDNGSVNIKGIKGWTLFSAINRSTTLRHQNILLRYFPMLEPAQNIVQRGLTDFGALAHPLTMLFNANRIDRNSAFLFYREGFTERTIALMERMEQEFRAIAAAYDTSIIPMPALLERYYGCDSSSLLKAMQSVPQYQALQAPDTLQHRFIEEDVSCSLVPMHYLAKKAGIDTPMIDSIITLAATLYGADFLSNGRNLARLGWSELSHAQILNAINE